VALARLIEASELDDHKNTVIPQRNSFPYSEAPVEIIYRQFPILTQPVSQVEDKKTVLIKLIKQDLLD